MNNKPIPQRLQNFHARTASYDYMLCVDFEATCDEVEDYEPNRVLIVSPTEMEIIEVGLAVMSLRSLDVIDRFQRYVRHPTLTSFCTNLTSIQQADMDAADEFPQISEQVTEFLTKYPKALWGSWGQYDADQLKADAKRAHCTPALLTLEHIDVEKVYQDMLAGPSID
jgi:3'-5' exoribonuclease 1